jgi:hypothetical protein
VGDEELGERARDARRAQPDAGPRRTPDIWVRACIRFGLDSGWRTWPSGSFSGPQSSELPAVRPDSGAWESGIQDDTKKSVARFARSRRGV